MVTLTWKQAGRIIPVVIPKSATINVDKFFKRGMAKT